MSFEGVDETKEPQMIVINKKVHVQDKNIFHAQFDVGLMTL